MFYIRFWDLIFLSQLTIFLLNSKLHVKLYINYPHLLLDDDHHGSYRGPPRGHCFQ